MLASLFDYNFVSNALLSMVLISMVAGVVGTYIVVRRMVFVAGGITHSAFGGIGLAYYLGLSPIAGAMLFAVATALGIEALNSNARVREDSAIAMLWSLGMSVGVIFMFLTPGYAPNLMGFMFGDVLAVSQADIYAVGILALLVVIGAVVFYRAVLYVAFSPDFARISGWKVRGISAVLSVVVALSIVLSIKAVGIILVLSLFTVPQAIANIYVRSMGRMMCLSAMIAVALSVAGLVVSFLLDLPAGAVITALLVTAFLILRLINNLISR